MVPGKEPAVFNVKAVVRETKLKPDTLRAWERRYGLPRPQRSAGGQRLYSQRDIDTLKWLVSRQEEGLSISRAVDLWRAASPTPDTGIWRSGDLDALRADWLSHCAAFREAEAERVLAHAFSFHTVEAVCVAILQKGVAELNDRWYQGEATVQQVYFASELVVRHMEGLLASAPRPARPERLFVACPPQEGHTLGALLVSLLLRRQGWDVLYLGASVPLENLDTTLSAAKLNLVILVAQQLTTAASLLEAARLVTHAGIPLAYGGRIFNQLPALRPYIPGYFIGESLVDTPQVVGRLLSGPFRLPSADPVPVEYQQALAHYLSRQPMLEAEVLQAMTRLEIPDAQVTHANGFLTRNIAAALAFGDMSLLDQEIIWLEGLFSNHRMPISSLYRYLHAYYMAAKAHLDPRGRPVVTWLAHITGHES